MQKTKLSRWQRIQQWRPFIGIVMLAIGISGTVIFYEGKKLAAEHRETMQAYESAQRLLDEIKNNKGDGGPVKAEPNSTPDQSAVEETSSLPAPGNIEKKILDKFGKDGEVALAVAKAESHLNPTAINVNRNGTKDAGIFQINDCHGFSVEERFNADKNIEIAFALYQKSGFQPWVTYKTNTYKQFL